MAAVEFMPTLPPSKNELYERTFRHTKKYKSWRKSAGWEIKLQAVRSIKGPYRLSIRARRPDNRRRDLGNLLEATEDLLTTMGIIEDDSLSESIRLDWVTTIASGVVIRVETAGVA